MLSSYEVGKNLIHPESELTDEGERDVVEESEREREGAGR